LDKEWEMNSSGTDKLQAALESIRELMQEHVYPLESDFLSHSRGFQEIVPALHAVRKRVKELGLWAPFLPKKYGGMGFTLTEYARIAEELGRSVIAHFIFNCQAPDVGNMELLIEHGNDAQKETYLVPLASGEIRSSFAMTEPDYPGSNPTWMDTLALKDGNDYVINGRKWFSTSADGSQFSIVMAVTNPEAENRYKRSSMIIVPTDTPGFNLVRNTPVMGEPGEGHASHGEIDLVDCRVAQTNLLGPEGEGFTLAQQRLGPGRIHHCMRWIGICERAFDLMCKYAVTRQIAPGRPLSQLGPIQNWIAESRAEINAARLLVTDASQKIDEQGTKAAREDISIIKFYVAGVLQDVLDRAIQVHGGLGMTDYTPLAYWYRHERAARIYDGPDEVHKWSVGRRILERYAENEK
jgi:alkylation response protein AidB-like acyl-CoA dehydrogenase